MGILLFFLKMFGVGAGLTLGRSGVKVDIEFISYKKDHHNSNNNNNNYNNNVVSYHLNGEYSYFGAMLNAEGLLLQVIFNDLYLQERDKNGHKNESKRLII